MNRKGVSIVFDGGEGSGKTTQANLLYQWLVDRGYPATLTSEPGGHGGVGLFIRKLLRDPQYKDRIHNLTEFFLFEAARAQHIHKEVNRALSEGRIVICDRFNASTYSYQVMARKAVSEKDFLSIDHLATGGRQPNFSFWFDINPAVGLKRKKRQGILTRFEKEKLSFHRKVRRGFEAFYKKYIPKKRWLRLNGQRPTEKLHEEILKILKTKKVI